MGGKQESVKPTTVEGESGMIVKNDDRGSIEIQPAAVGDEKTLQIAIICLTVIAMVIIEVGVYSNAIDANQIVPPIITAIAGLLGGQALRK